MEVPYTGEDMLFFCLHYQSNYNRAHDAHDGDDAPFAQQTRRLQRWIHVKVWQTYVGE